MFAGHPLTMKCALYSVPSGESENCSTFNGHREPKGGTPEELKEPFLKVRTL